MNQQTEVVAGDGCLFSHKAVGGGLLQETTRRGACRGGGSRIHPMTEGVPEREEAAEVSGKRVRKPSDVNSAK